MYKLRSYFYLSISFVTLFLLSFETLAEDAKIVRFKGKVTVNKTRVRSKIKVKEGSVVKAHGSRSFVQLKFKDGSMVLLRDGELRIAKKENTGKKKGTVLGLAKGVLFSFAHGDKEEAEPLRINTSRASFAVRGTKFFLQEDNKYSYLCVCEGTVEAKNNQGRVLVSRGEDIHVRTGKKLVKHKAPDVMWKIAWEGFVDMGFKANY